MPVSDLVIQDPCLMMYEWPLRADSWIFQIVQTRRVRVPVKQDAPIDDAEERRKSLNESGVFLHSMVLERMKKAGCEVYSEVPVSAAPFLSDPSKEASVMGWTNGTSMSLDVQKFQKAVADSQNEPLRRETAVDVVARKRDGVLCVEVKKLNRKYVDWVFVKQDVVDDEFFAMTNTASRETDNDLLHVPETSRTAGLSLRMMSYSLEYLLPDKYDQGVSLTRDRTDKYSFKSNSLTEAARQIVEGTFGLIVESLIKHVSAGKDNDQSFIPIVVTTANILVCEYSPEDLTVEGVSKLNLEPRDAVIYDCPVPMRAKFPNQIADIDNREQMRRFIRWPVLVVSPRGLDKFLSAVKADG